MLALVKVFLEAPIVDERDGGGPKRNRRGTRQGGVISPLLANLYLHLLDRNLRKRRDRGELEGRLVRYADDLVLLARQRPDRELTWIQSVMDRLGLSLHPDKTSVLAAENRGFTFLGHAVRHSGGRASFDMSKEALVRTRDEPLVAARAAPTSRLCVAL